MTVEKLYELAKIFEAAGKSPTNCLDPPWDCVAINLKPETWGALATVIRSAADRLKSRRNSA